MNQIVCALDSYQLTLETGLPHPPPLVLVERKGWGHPDTMADQLAEYLSRSFCEHTIATFGYSLHHNFDKLALLGGASEVRYGAGRILEPVRVLVNGRATRSCEGTNIPLDDIVHEAVDRFFAERLPELVGHLDIRLNITTTSSPGSVVAGGGTPTARDLWFNPRSIDDLRERRQLLANDTSFGTGWAPAHPLEAFALQMVDRYSRPGPFRSQHMWCGSDVKFMGFACPHEIDIVMAVPQRSPLVKSRSDYLENRQFVTEEGQRMAGEFFDVPARVRVNLRDLPDQDEIYLTYTGSSIESGDEGVVGRGNRANGLITPLRPMNLEGANGKNPVYHVGKIYNIVAIRIAQRLVEIVGKYTEVHLISATGQPLSTPWRIVVRTSADDLTPELVASVASVELDNLPSLTSEIIWHGVDLS